MLAADKFSLIGQGDIKVRQSLSRLPFHSIYLNVSLIAIEMKGCLRIRIFLVV
jgi:hypothetical protein